MTALADIGVLINATTSAVARCYQYAMDAANGKIITCEKTQMACRRFISKDIEIVKYTLTANVGKVSDLVAQNKSLATGLVIAVVYIAVSIAISMLSIEKKDVV